MTKGTITEIANIISKERDGVKATNNYVAFYETRPFRARLNAYHQIRKQVYDDDNNRNKYYFDRVATFMEDYKDELTEEDVFKLKRLLRLPLNKQNQIEHSFKSYLSTRQLSLKLREIRTCIAPLYDFKMPPDWKSQATRQVKARREILQGVSTTRENEGHFKLSNEQLMDIIIKAREIVDSPTITKKTKEYPNLIVSLMILTGRRLVEVCKTMTLLPVEGNEFQARVDGIAKRREDQQGILSDVIPLLHPLSKIQEALESARRHKQYTSNEECALKMASCTTAATTRLFGCRLSHTARRNIYLEAAYENKEKESRFLVGDHAVSKRQWMNMALYMQKPRLEDIDYYTRIEIVK